MIPQYDYIITGAGCAGLSLAVHLHTSGAFAGKRILLMDESPKNSNDRTWCFWEKTPGPFEEVVFRRWERLWFYGEGFEKELDLAPYTYKMIRGLDFYQHCRKLLALAPNIEFRQGRVETLFSDEANGTGVVVNGETIHSDWVFNSILFDKPHLRPKQHWLLQHFKGWVVEAGAGAFNPTVGTLMDFRVSQQHGTAFCYMLPFSDREALVEYTLFTENLLEPAAYDAALTDYLDRFCRIGPYTVRDTEFGVIPMTNYRFPTHRGRIVNIGTAGGQTKGSSGYTFSFIQRHSAAVVEALRRTGRPPLQPPSRRFHFYDSVLLDVLQHGHPPGKQIFTTLFRRNRPANVLTFLDNASSLAGDLRIISSLPTLPFLKGAIRQQL